MQPEHKHHGSQHTSEAEMRWHLRSTCQVIGVKREQTVLLREVPVVEPVYLPMSLPYSPSMIMPRIRSG